MIAETRRLTAKGNDEEEEEVGVCSLRYLGFVQLL
jgi:hypothetical protein